jgi:hypothetical protein
VRGMTEIRKFPCGGVWQPYGIFHGLFAEIFRSGTCEVTAAERHFLAAGDPSRLPTGGGQAHSRP